MPSLKDLIEPMPGKVAVQIKTADEMKGGLYLPQETVRSLHERRATQGIVVAIGSDDELDEPECKFKVGDTVVFGKYSGTEIKYQPMTDEEGDENVITRKARPAPETIIVMTFKDILCIIRSPEEAANLKVRG